MVEWCCDRFSRCVIASKASHDLVCFLLDPPIWNADSSAIGHFADWLAARDAVWLMPAADKLHRGGNLHRGWATCRRPHHRRVLDAFQCQRRSIIMTTVWLKKSPWRLVAIFPKRLGIFQPNFMCLLCVPTYARLRIFIQLSATLTKLCHNKRDQRPP